MKVPFPLASTSGRKRKGSEHISSLHFPSVPHHSSALTNPTSGQKSHIQAAKGAEEGGPGIRRLKAPVTARSLCYSPNFSITSAITVSSATVPSSPGRLKRNQIPQAQERNSFLSLLHCGRRKGGEEIGIHVPLAFPFAFPLLHYRSAHLGGSEAPLP